MQKAIDKNSAIEDDNSESDRHAKATSLSIARLVLNDDDHHQSKEACFRFGGKSSSEIDKRELYAFRERKTNV